MTLSVRHAIKPLAGLVCFGVALAQDATWSGHGGE
jgi:hypothetical protein